jgi:Leucine-rich repeat (LRR) protein
MPPSIRDLELDNTALGPLDSFLFTGSGCLSKLETLVLIRNMNMGHSISDGIPGLSLKNLCVSVQLDPMSFNNLRPPRTIQSQGVASLPLNFFNSAMARSLTFLDLSNNALTNTVPDTSSLSNLVTLNLAANNFTTTSQTTSFPQTLQSVSFRDNRSLAGLLPTTLCSSSTLKTCDFSMTVFSQLGRASCGVCKFS